MLRSMTGFGRAEGVVAEKKVTVEVRSLNSKQLDLFIKLPSLYKEKDSELRQWASEEVVRGKSEIFVNSELAPGVKRSHFDVEMVRSYYEELRGIAQSVDRAAHTDLMSLVLRMPDVLNTGREELTDTEWAGVLKLIHDAMHGFNGFREAEGRKLNDDLRMRVEHISALLVEVDGQDTGRAERTRERIRARLYVGELYSNTGPPFDASSWGAVTHTQVGTLTVQFTRGNAASLTYTLDGVLVVRNIQRLVFGTPATECFAPGDD